MNFWRNLLGVQPVKREQVRFVPLKTGYTAQDLRERVQRLTTTEREIYKWLRENYTLGWIAETLMMEK